MTGQAESTAGPSGPGSGRLGTVLYLAGLAGLVGSALAYPGALLAGWDVRPVVAINAASVGLLVAWAAHDTLADPGSAVTTTPGAVGTAMVLLAIYGLLAAVVLAITSPWHGHLEIALALAAGTLVAGVLGVLTFPLEALAGESEEGPESDGERESAP
jgi:hypothetical protein